LEIAQLCYFFLPLACANALAATDFVFVDVRPSRKSAEAFLATLALVTLLLLDFLAIALSPFSCLP
jgi:cellulose biosynthesis protein BcsQ